MTIIIIRLISIWIFLIATNTWTTTSSTNNSIISVAETFSQKQRRHRRHHPHHRRHFDRCLRHRITNTLMVRAVAVKLVDTTTTFTTPTSNRHYERRSKCSNKNITSSTASWCYSGMVIGRKQMCHINPIVIRRYTRRDETKRLNWDGRKWEKRNEISEWLHIIIIVVRARDVREPLRWEIDVNEEEEMKIVIQTLRWRYDTGYARLQQ